MRDYSTIGRNEVVGAIAKSLPDYTGTGMMLKSMEAQGVLAISPKNRVSVPYLKLVH
jgi:hypothetical protein